MLSFIRILNCLVSVCISHRSGIRDSSVVGAGNFFLFITVSRQALGQPPTQRLTEALSLGVKRPRREADYLPSSSAEVKNAWRYASIPPIHFNGVVLS